MPKIPHLDPPPLYQFMPIGVGVSGKVHVIDGERVVKVASKPTDPSYSDEGLRDHIVERRVYERLGSHPRICRCLASTERGLILERFPECLRRRLLSLKDQGVVTKNSQVLKWSLHAAEGLAYLHQHRVFQGDVGCHNLLLDQDDNLKLCDFGGAWVDGDSGSVIYGTRSTLAFDPNAVPDRFSEIFALGSTLYEISTTKEPYCDETDYAVEQLYKRQQYPETKHLLLGHIIQNCWTKSYDSVQGVLEDLHRLERLQQHTHSVPMYSFLALFRRQKLLLLAPVLIGVITLVLRLLPLRKLPR